jgi:hypothetical protein
MASWRTRHYHTRNGSVDAETSKKLVLKLETQTKVLTRKSEQGSGWLRYSMLDDMQIHYIIQNGLLWMGLKCPCQRLAGMDGVTGKIRRHHHHRSWDVCIWSEFWGIVTMHPSIHVVRCRSSCGLERNRYVIQSSKLFCPSNSVTAKRS